MTIDTQSSDIVLALDVRKVTKAYGATRALDGASFSCQVGEVHGLLGENGAGKSTMVKILSGLVRPDEGEIAVMGNSVSLENPRMAHGFGIATAFQEITMIPYLTVAQNLLLFRERSGRFGLNSPSRTSEAAAEILAEWDAGGIDPNKLVSDLTLADRQRLELIRALSRRPKIALLDEATAALGSSDVDWLFRLVAKFKSSGGTVVYISHRMGEIRELCDRCTVLKNGKEVGTFPTSEVSDSQAVEMMAGRAVQHIYAEGRYIPKGSETALVVENLSFLPTLVSVSFELRQGEILGMVGLQGHGQKELFMSLFGAHRAKGRLEVNGTVRRLRSTHDAVAAGIGLIPEERKVEGLMVEMGGLANLTIVNLSQFTRAGFVRRSRERAAAVKTLITVNASVQTLDREVGVLSGGNQQKLAIGKWLLAGSRILLMFDPTRGVDVETKAEIFRLMRRQVEQGQSILFYSTDVEEIVNIANRALVMYRGRIVAVLEGESLTKEALVSAMMSTSREVVA
jgi:ribose transport system ATP-binding protein